MAHVKPTVFFSHSSRDKLALTTLRDVFNKKTGNTIDVFASSDGQSIAFGSNWVHGVEDALARSKLMFVFLTPNATRSQWVPFEAGHAYGRGLHVVPVAMWGVDLAAVGPPLSLLQGFNVTSRESLSNIIATSNREFGFTHADFTSEEYAEIMSRGPELSALGAYGVLVDDVGAWLGAKEITNGVEVGFRALPGIAAGLGLEGIATETSFRIPGLSVSLDRGNSSLLVNIDPGSLGSVATLLNAWLKQVRAGGAKNVRFVFTLTANVDAVLEDYKISGRLAAFGVRPGTEPRQFVWNDLVFSLERGFSHRGGGFEPTNFYLAVWPAIEELRIDRVNALLDLLFERQIVALAV